MRNDTSQQDANELKYILATLTKEQKSIYLQQAERTAYSPTHIDKNLKKRAILAKNFVSVFIKDIYINLLEYFHLVKHRSGFLTLYLMLIIGNLYVFLSFRSIQALHYYNMAILCFMLSGFLAIITKSHQRVPRSYLYAYLIIAIIPMFVAIFLPIFYLKSEAFLRAISAAALEYLALLLAGSNLFTQQQETG